MFRLILLTIGGLFAVLLIFGGRDAPVQQPESRPVAQTESEPARARAFAIDGVSLTTIAAPVADPASAPSPRFAGPRLQPSPEHRDPSPAATTLVAIPANALYVTGATVNLRAGPTTEADIVDRLSRGTPVEPLGPTSGAWIQLRTLDGNRGFMSASFLSPNDPG